MSERSPDQNVVLPDKWQVLVVDDDPTGHLIPRSVMENLTFEGKPVEVIDAYSSREAIEYLKTYPDIAVAVIDIILETRDEGLQLVRIIREEMENKLIRIILRTSEEHHFPENQIIIDYDINGYTGRNESSAKQLVTSIITAFRSYQDLRTIYKLNRSLEEKVRDRTKALSDANFKLRSYISRLENDQEAGSKM
ncbi:MAG: response regulator receiver protein, partial [Sediminispirochaetaceae bacterium]